VTGPDRRALVGHAVLIVALVGAGFAIRPSSPPAPVSIELPPTDTAPAIALPTSAPPTEPPLVAPATDVRIGTALEGRRGTATWCAPTSTHCHGWGGNAHVGAVRSFGWGDTPYSVAVCVVATGSCTNVRVVSYCACPHTLIDLSPAAFEDLAPLSAGRIGVTVTRVSAPRPPQTDTDGSARNDG
jgi:hypothetical protein